MYIILTLLIIVFACFFVPVRLYINYGIKTKIKKDSKADVEQSGNDYILVKILYFIPIMKLSLNKKKKESSKKDNNKNSNRVQNKKKTKSKPKKKNYVLDSIYSLFMELVGYSKYKYIKNGDVSIGLKDIKKVLSKTSFDKFHIEIGFNLDSPIINSYANATINTLLCLYINKNIDKFDMRHLYYRVYISEEIYKLHFNGILRFKIADTIDVVFRTMYKMIKAKFKKRKVEGKNGRASNRKFDDDSNVITRKYD